MVSRSHWLAFACMLSSLLSACDGTDEPTTPDGGGQPGTNDAGQAEADPTNDAGQAEADPMSDGPVDASRCDNRPETGGVRTCIGCPGEMPGVNCYPPQQDGGIYGRCRLDGEDIEGKVIGAYCCNHDADSGAIGHIINSLVPSDGGECTPVAPPSVLICSRCGDGTCSSWENRCNCAVDCP